MHILLTYTMLPWYNLGREKGGQGYGASKSHHGEGVDAMADIALDWVKILQLCRNSVYIPGG